MKNLKSATRSKRDHIEVKVKFTDRHGKVQTYHKGTIKRFLSKLRGSSGRRIDILVTYGREKDVFGNVEMFKNEYSGFNNIEAQQALEAFLEV